MSGRMVLSVVLQACGMVTATTGLVLFFTDMGVGSGRRSGDGIDWDMARA